MIEPSDIYMAFCLMMVFEGLIYGLLPRQMKGMILQILALPEKTLQNFGLGIAAFGVFLLYLAV